jgi:hypothetical protein
MLTTEEVQSSAECGVMCRRGKSSILTAIQNINSV